MKMDGRDGWKWGGEKRDKRGEEGG